MKTRGFATIRHEWLGNIRGDVLSGTVVALALIPEAIGFALIAGVDPKVGLYAAFSICFLTSIFGGRPGMISGATAAVAVLFVVLVKDHGVQYLFAATILAGLLQMLFGLLQISTLMRFISQPVMNGFVNALAILIFMAQLPELLGQNAKPLTFIMVGVGLLILYLFPRLIKAIPAPLVCIIVLTAAAYYLNLDVRTVGQMGDIPESLPVFAIPSVPFTFETLIIIFPYALAAALVGLLESLMTTNIVDELTDTYGNKTRECIGQGIANSVTGFFGGMAGCAMIGQSMINVKSGGRGRLSSCFAGLFLLFLILILNDLVAIIPTTALVAVMIMVSIGTFSWSSVKNIPRNPATSSLVMLVVVVAVVYTHNLAIGVIAGVILSALFFAWKIARLMTVTSNLSDDGLNRTYHIEGQLFFVSVSGFTRAFDFGEALNKVTIDVSHAHIWDLSAVTALDQVVLKFRREGAEVELIGMNKASELIIKKHAVHDKENAKLPAGH
ncbi:SulP family inorganic anion transporter [Bartonella sp. HY761]|uniref:SulP family inorganic anion transporter n=1 Tax=Bartonella sp. HY761 TaxID=2979330 RepID=UPI00220F9B5A|nr:SulP family inorganic anion transporter [Bartonella sp. HY761]UXN06013.1 SulP family inorganic anion transporter [Bartonella sp. HY761]